MNHCSGHIPQLTENKKAKKSQYCPGKAPTSSSLTKCCLPLRNRVNICWHLVSCLPRYVLCFVYVNCLLHLQLVQVAKYSIKIHMFSLWFLIRSQTRSDLKYAHFMGLTFKSFLCYTTFPKRFARFG